MKSLKYYLARARQEKWAIGQFNFSTLDVLQAIIRAAIDQRAPVILGTSEGENKFFGLQEAIILRDFYRKKFKTPLFLNLDHGRNLEYIKEAIRSGYDAVHFDGSELPLEENIEILRKLKKFIGGRNVILEGSIGELAGHSGYFSELPKKRQLTDPKIAREFAKKTRVDSVAVAIGSVHGMYKKEPKIDFERLKKISQDTKAFLVLHGGSGIERRQLRKMIRLGIVKININTELRLAWKKEIEKIFRKHPSEVKPYFILADAQEAVRAKVATKIQDFNSKNKI